MGQQLSLVCTATRMQIMEVETKWGVEGLLRLQKGSVPSVL